VARERCILGIDLGGASSNTTGIVVLRGRDRPTVQEANILARGAGPAEAEQNLLGLVDEWKPDVVAIDAPLTLPPCMTCPPFCRGPGVECELRAAQEVWDAGGNPVSQRLTELHLRTALPTIKPPPLPTMQMGVLTARAVAFARRLSARAFVPGAHQPAQLLEVYPRATLHQHGSAEPSLGPRAPNEADEAYAVRVVDGFEPRIDGIDPYRPRLVQREHHVLDALVAAYTGWLSPSGLQQPPPGFNTSTGWIWFPKVDAIPADAS
jgi:predicted nuclease with RNAse H fold